MQPPAVETAASALPQAMPPGTSPRQPDARAMQEVIAQVQELGVLDPAAREQLLENLHETPPELWPLVVQQFRAAVAYRRQAEANETAQLPCPAPAGTPPQGMCSIQGDYLPSPFGRGDGDEGGSCGRGPVSKSHSENAACPAASPLGDRVGPLPTSVDGCLAAAVAPAIGPDGTESPLLPTRDSRPSAAAQPPLEPDSRVVTASYELQPADDWQQHVAEAVRALESELGRAPQSDDDVARHARLRMLCLIAGRREEALRPIPAIAPSAQDFWSKELYGLATLLDTERIAEPTRRAAEAQRHLGDAVARLGESSPLVVQNLAFITDVQSYGAFTPFEKYEFTPGQKVLLYAEVENYKTKESAKGHHTALRSSYQIFDSGGRRVAYHEFDTKEEHCRNRRRDFFVGYQFFLPERIYPGEHVLELTVEDLNGGKIGQSTIRFTVVAPGR